MTYVYDDDFLKSKKHIHFIGIGGSGMFPIVQILHDEGFYITGSDNNPTDTTEKEKSMGIPVYIGQRPENIEGADLIVVTAAIMEDNPELIAAKNSDADVLSRAEMLGLLTRRYSNAICISGTHGKTTTTSMLTLILLRAGLDPGAVIGGKLKAIGGGGRRGGSENMVCEACEFSDTFLSLAPDTAVVLNIDADHLDYFGTIERVIESFEKFCSMATKSVIANISDPNTVKMLKGIGDKNIITFGTGSNADYYYENEEVGPVSSRFDLMYRGDKLCTVTLNIPGKHNILNAVAACAAAIGSGVPAQDIPGYLEEFRGAARRFEILGKKRGITVADDYAHHPAELRATLESAMAMGYRRVWAVFQPFTYSRTAMLLDDFAEVLKIPDRVVMSEIMGGREKNTYNIYTKQLADRIPGSVWFDTFEEITKYVIENAGEGDLVITLGCGDVNKCSAMILREL